MFKFTASKRNLKWGFTVWEESTFFFFLFNIIYNCCSKSDCVTVIFLHIWHSYKSLLITIFNLQWYEPYALNTVRYTTRNIINWGVHHGTDYMIYYLYSDKNWFFISTIIAVILDVAELLENVRRMLCFSFYLDMLSSRLETNINYSDCTVLLFVTYITLTCN